MVAQRFVTGLTASKQLLGWLELGTSKFHSWKDRYGKANEHNGRIPRDFWLEDWERQAILDDHDSHPLDGYRRLTLMMLDDDIVAVSPSSVDRSPATGWSTGSQLMGSVEERHRFRAARWTAQTLAHRCVLHQRRRHVLFSDQRALEKFPGERPRIISDNGSQFTARDFKQFVRLLPDQTDLTIIQPSDLASCEKTFVARCHNSFETMSQLVSR